MAHYRGLAASPIGQQVAALTVRGKAPPRLFSTAPRAIKGKRIKPNVRLIGIDHATGKVTYMPLPGRGLTASVLVNRHTINAPTLSGPPNVSPLAALRRGLTSGQLVNRRTADRYYLAGVRAPLTRVGGAEQNATWGLGDAGGAAVRVVNVPLVNLLQTTDGALGRSFFGDIGAAVSKAVKDVGGAVSRNITAVAKIALPVLGVLAAPFTGGLSIPLGASAAGLIQKTRKVSTGVVPALATGGAAVTQTVAEHNALAAQALQLMQDPNASEQDRAAAAAMYQYLTQTVSAINGGIATATNVATGGENPTLAPASTVVSATPPWLLPAAAALIGIMVLRR